MKKISLLIALLFTGFSVFAQLGYNYAQYSIGAGISSTTLHGDLNTTYNHPSFAINLSYHYTPFVTFGIESQFGRLESANADSAKTYYGEYSTNKFTMVMFHADLQLGELYNYEGDVTNVAVVNKLLNAAKNIYFGTGAGIIFNNITDVNRVDYKDQNIVFSGLDKSNELVIPFRVGYEYKIYNAYDEPQYRINIGYQGNYSVGDNMDGIKSGHYGDWFSQITFGIKVGIGGVTSYRKPIHVGNF